MYRSLIVALLEDSGSFIKPFMVMFRSIKCTHFYF